MNQLFLPTSQLDTWLSENQNVSDIFDYIMMKFFSKQSLKKNPQKQPLKKNYSPPIYFIMLIQAYSEPGHGSMCKQLTR